MKKPKAMQEIHKIREKMSKLSKKFDKRMANALKGWEDLVKE